MTKKAREHFSSKIGFFFAAIGSAVGLGVLWKFPYIVGQNGGALFLLAYVACTILIGIPVFAAELLLGRRTQRSAIGVFSLLMPTKPFWKLAGWLGVVSSFLIMSFYSVVAGWGLSYMVSSITGASRGMSAEKVSEMFKLLVGSPDLCLLWHFLFTLMAMMIVFSGVRKGIEHWSRIMTRSLFAMLFALFLYSCTLPGMGPAIEFILYPNFETFTFSSVLEALGLSFFTLSLGQGIMFSYGSYTSDQEDLPMMSIIVSFAVIIVAILGALTIFPVVFTFGFEPSAGTGLIFQALPYLFSKLPGGVLISTLFFSLFVFAGLTSAMAFVEVVASNMMELMGWSRKKAALLVSMATFIFGIPSALAGSGILFSDWQEIYRMNFLETMDNFVSVWLIPVGGLITTIFVGWIWNKEASQEEFLKGSSCSPRLFSVWYYAMRFLVPGLIILIILQKSGLINFD